MSDCRVFIDLLPLHAGNDLEPREADEVAAHLAGCRQCRVALSEYQTVITPAVFLDSSEITMSDIARRRVAAEAAAAVRASGWLALPHAVLRRRSSALAVAAAAVLALVAIPFVQRNGDAARPAHEITEIDIVSAPNGQVTLAWTNGSHDAYTVYKSSDPKDFRDGEAHVVLGTVWTDTSPAPGQVVFYRVE
jgi:hypothetical protein